jgi:hypothetical protein
MLPQGRRRNHRNLPPRHHRRLNIVPDRWLRWGDRNTHISPFRRIGVEAEIAGIGVGETGALEVSPLAKAEQASWYRHLHGRPHRGLFQSGVLANSSTAPAIRRARLVTCGGRLGAEARRTPTTSSSSPPSCPDLRHRPSAPTTGRSLGRVSKRWFSRIAERNGPTGVAGPSEITVAAPKCNRWPGNLPAPVVRLGRCTAKYQPLVGRGR